MDTNPLFPSALGRASPWQVTTSDVHPEQRLLELHVDFKPGARFACLELRGGWLTGASHVPNQQCREEYPSSW